MNVFLSLLLAVPPRKHSIDVSVENENREDEIIDFLYGDKIVRMPRKGLMFSNRVPLKISGGCGHENECYCKCMNKNKYDIVNVCIKIINIMIIGLLVICCIIVFVNIYVNIAYGESNCSM